MKDLKQEIETTIKTGKVFFGAKEVIWALLNGNPKFIILSANCPNNILDKVKYYALLSKTPFLILEKNSQDLGIICGKSFSVSSLAIMDEGESSILGLKKKKKE